MPKAVLSLGLKGEGTNVHTNPQAKSLRNVSRQFDKARTSWPST